MQYAIGILRVSSTKQGLQGDSPDDQKEQIIRRAEQLSSVLGEEVRIKRCFKFTESASGELDTQPILKTIEYCKNSTNKVKYAFFKSIDRGTRGGAVIYGQLKTQFARYGVQLVDVYGVISTQEVNTLAHLGIEYKWSKFSPSFVTELLEAERGKSEVRDILTRLIGAEINYVRLGYRVRQAPMGYKNVKTETTHGVRVVLAPHEVEAKWIIRMFELRVQGNLSDEEIVNQINRMGYKSRIRKKRDPFDKTKVFGHTGGISLTVKQLQMYIEKPIYAGINVEKWTEGKPVKSKFQGLITVDLFNKANRGKVTILENGDEVVIYKGKPAAWLLKKDKNNPEFPYKSKVMCPVCNNPLYGSAPRSKSGKHVPTYHCARKHKYWGINRKIFNQTIEDFCGKLDFSDEFTNKLNKYVLEEWDKLEKQVLDVTVDVNKQIAQKEEEILSLKETIKKLTSQTAIQLIEEDIEKARLDKANLMERRNNKEFEQLDIQILTNTTKYYMEHLDDLLLGSTNPMQNAAMFGLVFEDLPTYDDIKFGTPNLAPIFKLKEAYEASEERFVSRQGLEP